ncbi:HpcH/HpaI aldolase family protein [Brevibacillus massiliensis]|uniref:HpcH/HpaI aldolase family protein n=1 Tax=Brevibacillus massiliensis TaxID=1118054 RepID=UPI0002FD31AD|nr:aldolase/citrate lyase family protein [Brevibacillus massiliensis]
MEQNSIKNKLQAGECVYGTWLRMTSPIVVEALGSVGFDFLHVDMEHSAIDLQMLDYMVLAGTVQNVPLIVRTATQNPADLYRVMDLGVSSFILPRIETAEQCEKLLKGARYAPAGTRGLGGPVRANRWGMTPLEQHLAEAQQETAMIIQIESEPGLANLESILEVPGIDVVYIGPLDLSQALGYPGQVEHPKVKAAIQSMTETIRKRGIAVGIHASSPEQAKEWAAQGIQYFTVGMDVVLLQSAGLSLVDSLKKQRA